MSAPFVWFDLTTAGGGVGEFYQELFGWAVGPGAGEYAGWFTGGGKPWAGVVAARRETTWVRATNGNRDADHR